MKKRYLIPALIILSIASIFIGVKEISFLDILNLRDDKIQILLLSRLPRLISIIAAGIGMSISGLIMQQITQNKFVSPTTAATIDSAKLGILVSLIIFSAANTFTKMIVSFVFSLAGSFLFMTILKKLKYKNAIIIPLLGIMLGKVIDSVTTFFAYKYDLVQNISSWLQGSFSMVIKGRYELLYISIPLVFIAFMYANKFTLAGMGEDFSTNLGLNYNSVVNIGISIVALISSIVVITVGKIPFLGLVIPNIVTMYQGDNLKKNILPTALFGAVFLLFCDILGRLIIYPYEIPIGLTVGVIGSLIFLYLLLVRRNT
ncbi:ABC transporter permease [Proteiniborus sp. MB09-C3]|uniref:ABC transporter permease n=1 Tax=Proteiniborus sp. MB09-C3 TaxID=3050072 RepID=UPI0025528B32|nr:ABC transporter permease [Proteiniborus sp. MB09-C3]WIV13404.1 ABC transporter permease [Proteiniborus sp. MB09-C3]